MAKKQKSEDTEETEEAVSEKKPKTTAKKEKATETKSKAPSKKEEAPKKQVPVETRRVFKRIKVNFWRTRLHAEAIGVYQAIKYMAKTRYFSKSFEIWGIVEIDGKEEYIIAYNEDQWHNSPVEEKRLICRMFKIMEEEMGLGKGGEFQGGIEFSFTHSLIQSNEIKRTGVVFFAQLPSTRLLTQFVKSRRFIGTRWAFPLLPEQPGDKLQVITANGVIGPGRNYNIFLGNRKVARVDGQPIRLNYEIEIYEEALAKDKSFVKLLALFGCACNFMDEIEKMLKKMYENLKVTGTSEFAPPKQEIDLFKNPRMMMRR